MKKIIITGIGVMLLFVSAFIYQIQHTKAVGSFFRSGADNPQYQTSSTTTSPAFIISGIGSTTLTFNTSDCDSITTTLQYFASSTMTKSWFQIDRLLSDDNVTFFNYNTALNNRVVTNGELTLASSTQPITLKPSTVGATTTTSFDLEIIPARYTRIVVGIASTTNLVRDRANVWLNNLCKIQNY